MAAIDLNRCMPQVTGGAGKALPMQLTKTTALIVDGGLTAVTR